MQFLDIPLILCSKYWLWVSKRNIASSVDSMLAKLLIILWQISGWKEALGVCFDARFVLVVDSHLGHTIDLICLWQRKLHAGHASQAYQFCCHKWCVGGRSTPKRQYANTFGFVNVMASTHVFVGVSVVIVSGWCITVL